MILILFVVDSNQLLRWHMLLQRLYYLFSALRKFIRWDNFNLILNNILVMCLFESFESVNNWHENLNWTLLDLNRILLNRNLFDSTGNLFDSIRILHFFNRILLDSNRILFNPNRILIDSNWMLLESNRILLCLNRILLVICLKKL